MSLDFGLYDGLDDGDGVDAGAIEGVAKEAVAILHHLILES